MRIPKDSVWRCIDEEAEEYDQLCIVLEIHDHPDFNGDGDIHLRYDDGSEHHGKVRRFIPGVTHERVSEVTPQERKERIQALRAQVDKLQAEIAKLKVECFCLTTIKKVHDSAKCDVCGKNHGWWCPKSPNHICDYEQPDGDYDEDSCRHCGKPEERK
jgi:hypothetical protein